MGLARACSATTADAEQLLTSAVALRWSRPDLTAAVAEHVAATWAADDRTWVAAAGWLVHGRAAVGDGRECASDALAELVVRDPALLDEQAADRLRIEVATLAAAQCEPAMARLLIEPLGPDRPAEVQADALAVLARCAFEDRPAAVGEATRRAGDAWSAVRGADAEIAVAALTLLSGSAARRAGHPDAAVDHAAEGLARLDDLRPGASAPHLAAALAAEWITALVEAGRTDDARAGCDAVAEHLAPTARPTRQRALLRLTVARALAASASPGAFEALEQAAADASACDAPDLEGLCLSTLGTLREQAGRLDAALESMRRGLAAQRRDRARSERFRAALRALPLLPSGIAAPAGSTGRRGAPVPSHATRGLARPPAERPGEPHPLAANPWTTGSWTTGSWTTASWTTGDWTGDGARSDSGREDRAVAAGAAHSTAAELLAAESVSTGRWEHQGVAAATDRGTAAERTGADRVPPSSQERRAAAVAKHSDVESDTTSRQERRAAAAGRGTGVERTEVEGVPTSGRRTVAAEAGRGTAVERAELEDFPTSERRSDPAAPGRNTIAERADAEGDTTSRQERRAVATGRGTGAERTDAEGVPTGRRERRLAAAGRDTGVERADVEGIPTSGSWTVSAAPGRSTSAERADVEGDTTGGRKRRAAAAGSGRGVGVERADFEGVPAAAGRPHAEGDTTELPAARSDARAGGDAGPAAPGTAFDPLFGLLDGTQEQGAVGAPADTGAAAAAGPPAVDRDSWLATALAELDRVWGSPLPGLGAVTDRPDEQAGAAAPAAATGAMASPPATAASAERAVLADDEQLVSPWAAWTEERGTLREPAVDNEGNAPAGQADDVSSTPDTADRPPVVGCVVVVDVVRAGAPVAEGVALLDRLSGRLADRIPAGARMRIDEGASTLSVVLPGQDRMVAAGWMHRTLPTAFHDVAAADAHELPVGSALRAAVHDTDGPVGAQLLQRLDVVRVNRDHAPPVPVRWGVPIAPGSGGRRRRPEAGGGVAVGAPVGLEGAQLGRHRDGPSAVASGEAIVAQLGPDAAGQQVDAHGGPPERRAEVNETAGGVAVASPASGGEARPSSGDTALAVEGLGLADLLAGALAAYRAI